MSAAGLNKLQGEVHVSRKHWRSPTPAKQTAPGLHQAPLPAAHIMVRLAHMCTMALCMSPAGLSMLLGDGCMAAANRGGPQPQLN